MDKKKNKALVIKVASVTYLQDGQLDTRFLSDVCKEIAHLLSHGIHVYLVGSPDVHLGNVNKNPQVSTRMSEADLITAAHEGHTLWKKEVHSATLHLNVHPMYIECTLDQLLIRNTNHLRSVCCALSKPHEQKAIFITENANVTLSEARMFREVTQYESFTEEVLEFLRRAYQEVVCVVVRDDSIKNMSGQLIPVITNPKHLTVGTRDKNTLRCDQKYPFLASVTKLAARCTQINMPCAVIGKDNISNIRHLGTTQFLGNYFSPNGNKVTPLI